jgi:FdhE protein
MNEAYLNHIERLIRQRPWAASALRSYGDLAKVMTEVQAPHQIKAEHAPVPEKNGFPLFKRGDLPLDFDGAALILNRMFEHLSGTEREDRSGMGQALKQSKENRQWSQRLFVAILAQDEKGFIAFSKEAGLEPQTLFFLGKTALRPSLEAFRCLMEKRLNGIPWHRGRCPLCGSQPDMARFTKNGKRMLHCELCGTQWAFARMGCPFCENREPETLGYFEAEGEEGLRVYFCDACHGYLKTVDARVFEQLAPLELESLATLHLDLVAQERGYQ